MAQSAIEFFHVLKSETTNVGFLGNMLGDVLRVNPLPAYPTKARSVFRFDKDVISDEFINATARERFCSASTFRHTAAIGE